MLFNELVVNTRDEDGAQACWVGYVLQTLPHSSHSRLGYGPKKDLCFQRATSQIGLVMHSSHLDLVECPVIAAVPGAVPVWTAPAAHSDNALSRHPHIYTVMA